METDRSPSLLKMVVILPLAAGIIVAAAVAMASRLQLPEGRPGVLMVTVPVPALVFCWSPWFRLSRLDPSALDS
ncbi:hypothetical protein ACIQH5_07780 [Paenarthrobacter sp. NPDC091711]|uniref:hypothetical protein n=1 Tax=Paenarthrobacter sp. NPDC091711 TaxID=3364385 RepID=UPI00382F5BA6